MTSDEQNLVVVASRSHGGQRLEQYLDQLAERFCRSNATAGGQFFEICARWPVVKPIVTPVLDRPVSGTLLQHTRCSRLPVAKCIRSTVKR